MDDLIGRGTHVEWPDADALSAAEAWVGRRTAGRLADLVEWWSGAQAAFPPPVPASPRLLRLATPSPRRAASPADALAADAGVPVRAVGAGGFGAGVQAADAEIDSGADLLLIAGRGSVDAQALLACVVARVEPVAVLPRGPAAVDTARWIARAQLLRDRRPALLAMTDRPDDVLDAIGDAALSTACGIVAGAVARRTPVLLDGSLAVSAALLVHAVQPRAAAWLRVADTSPDPVQATARDAMRQRPVLAHGVLTDDGTAGLLALAALRSAVALAAPADEGGGVAAPADEAERP